MAYLLALYILSLDPANVKFTFCPFRVNRKTYQQSIGAYLINKFLLPAKLLTLCQNFETISLELFVPMAMTLKSDFLRMCTHFHKWLHFFPWLWLLNTWYFAPELSILIVRKSWHLSYWQPHDMHLFSYLIFHVAVIVDI